MRWSSGGSMNVRGRGWWEEEVRVLLCAPPPRLRHSLSFLPQLTKPLHARAPTSTGGAQSFSSAVFGGVQPTGLAFLSCNYRVASGLVGLARSSVNRRHSDDIHILHLFLREQPCRSGIACPSTRRWKRLDSPHRVATVAREPKPQRATKARNHSIDCTGQTATVTLMSRGEFEGWKSCRWKQTRGLMSDSVMLSGRENSVASSVPRNGHRNSRGHGKADNILLNKAGTILLRSLRTSCL